MSGGGGTTVQKADPWAGLQPYLTGNYNGEPMPQPGLFQEAARLYGGGGPQYYPGSTVAGPSQDTLNSEDFIRRIANGQDWSTQMVYDKVGDTNRLLQGVAYGDNLNKVQNANYLDPTAAGSYLNGNPYLSAMADAAAKNVTRNFNTAVMPSIASQFATGGRYGSGAQLQGVNDATNNLATTLSNQATNIYGNAYQQERALQEAAIARGEAAQQNAIARERGYQTQAQMALPQLAMQTAAFRQGTAGLGSQLGQRIDARNQNNLNADIARWDFNQNAPWQNLGRLSQILQGWGGSQQSTSQPGGSFLSNALGASMLGNSLYGLGANAGLWGGAAGLGALGGMGLGSGALLGGATGLATTGALGGVAGGTSLFSTFAPMMALAL